MSPHATGSLLRPLLASSVTKRSLPAESSSQFSSKKAMLALSWVAFAPSSSGERQFFIRARRSDSHRGLATAEDSSSFFGGAGLLLLLLLEEEEEQQDAVETNVRESDGRAAAAATARPLRPANEFRIVLVKAFLNPLSKCSYSTRCCIQLTDFER